MPKDRVVIVGAGIGGLSAAIPLCDQGFNVTVVETAPTPGGKLSQTDIGGKAIDVGPTVFTMRWVFEDLFASVGRNLADHLNLTRSDILARHSWPDGSTFDLFADLERSVDAVGTLAGAAEASRFRDFSARAALIYRVLERPFMTVDKPNLFKLTIDIGLHRPRDQWAIMPYRSMWDELGHYFHDPRLRQLVGRYATYCGASPFKAPATMMLIAHVEQQGVWRVEGGMQQIPRALAALATELGATIRYDAPVARIETTHGRASGVILASGERIEADIVIGTHALLGSSIKFANLGLLIIDEEQHFGVKHKERLKELKSDIHVLTLSATPIPRTLQLAMTGVRELSLITTPPVDRLAVRTFISPFDALTIRETLLREHYRGGQSFYVCPRIADLEDVSAFLQSEVPELKVATAHGQMPPGQLDDIMNAFYDGQYDVLLSTTIVESGLDVPRANTLIVHRADMFGLAQLYQLRGRVGRSKVRAFALFTLPANRMIAPMAERRLKVLQSLDELGAGFQLASHDLDLRGAGNLLGEEQSGHIKEVGFELYQQMLEEAVAELKGEDEVRDTGWSPQITVGTPVMIPEDYVPDLHLRLGLYRRLGEITDLSEIDDFGAELIDRFGPMPTEVQHLLKIVYIKALCRTANVEKLDAGPKGVVVQFRDKQFPNPAGLVQHIARLGNQAKIRPDHSVVFIRELPTPEKRLGGAAVIMNKLAEIVKAA